MPLPFFPPVPTEADWVAHRRAVKVCRGTACYGALVAHYGTESPPALEALIDQREQYQGKYGDRSSSNKYRVWRRDGVLPSPETIEHVRMDSGGAVRLERFRDLCLWQLLDPEMPTIAWLHHQLESFPARIRKILFFDAAPNGMGRYTHFDIGREGICELRDLGTLDAVLALMCLAREGEVLSDDPRHSLPAMCAYDALPRALVANPALAYRWEALFACIERVFWRRAYGGNGAFFECSMEKFRSNLDALRLDPNAPQHQMGGRSPPKPGKALRSTF